MPFHLDQNTGILIKKAARLFEQVANRNLDQLKITFAQTTFLIRLWAKDGQSQIELAKSAGLSQPTVVRTLDRMERDGLIIRARNPTDRRVFNFYLTEKAKDICPKLESETEMMHTLSTQKISKKDLKGFNEYLLLIIDNLQKEL